MKIPELLEPDETAKPSRLWDHVPPSHAKQRTRREVLDFEVVGGLTEEVHKQSFYYRSGSTSSTVLFDLLRSSRTDTAHRIEHLEAQVSELRHRIRGIETKSGLPDWVLQRLTEYAETVRQIDAVQEVLLERYEDHWTLRTVLDSPAFHYSLRLPVYKEQGRLKMDLPADTPMRFRVVNRKEIRDTSDAGVELEHVQVLWRRS